MARTGYSADLFDERTRAQRGSSLTGPAPQTAAMAGRRSDHEPREVETPRVGSVLAPCALAISVGTALVSLVALLNLEDLSPDALARDAFALGAAALFLAAAVLRLARWRVTTDPHSGLLAAAMVALVPDHAAPGQPRRPGAGPRRAARPRALRPGARHGRLPRPRAARDDRHRRGPPDQRGAHAAGLRRHRARRSRRPGRPRLPSPRTGSPDRCSSAWWSRWRWPAPGWPSAWPPPPATPSSPGPAGSPRCTPRSGWSSCCNALDQLRPGTWSLPSSALLASVAMITAHSAYVDLLDSTRLAGDPSTTAPGSCPAARTPAPTSTAPSRSPTSTSPRWSPPPCARSSRPARRSGSAAASAWPTPVPATWPRPSRSCSRQRGDLRAAQPGHRARRRDRRAHRDLGDRPRPGHVGGRRRPGRWRGGLHGARALMARNGGGLELRNRIGGTTFVLVLPAAEDQRTRGDRAALGQRDPECLSLPVTQCGDDRPPPGADSLVPAGRAVTATETVPAAHRAAPPPRTPGPVGRGALLPAARGSSMPCSPTVFGRVRRSLVGRRRPWPAGSAVGLSPRGHRRRRAACWPATLFLTAGGLRLARWWMTVGGPQRLHGRLARRARRRHAAAVAPRQRPGRAGRAPRSCRC